MDEPKKMYSCVRDNEGHIWIRGRTRWSQMDGPGRLPWYALKSWYGPLSTDAQTDRIADRQQEQYREHARRARKGS